MNTLEAGTGRTRLVFAWQHWGRDLHVHIGGGQDHIGAAALAGRQSDGQTYEGTIRIPPHKENAIARKAATDLHAATGANVCVTAGIHLDDITNDEINAVRQTVDEAVALLIQRLQR